MRALKSSYELVHSPSKDNPPPVNSVAHLLPSYIILDEDMPAIHIPELRKHTSDISQFLRWYSTYRALERLDEESAEFQEIIDSLSDSDHLAVIRTCDECCSLSEAGLIKLFSWQTQL